MLPFTLAPSPTAHPLTDTPPTCPRTPPPTRGLPQFAPVRVGRRWCGPWRTARRRRRLAAVAATTAAGAVTLCLPTLAHCRFA